MGKPTGFMDYVREEAEDRNINERIKDWDEFHLHLPEDKQRIQGARCMECGVPFCHVGKEYGCPVNNLIPEFNDMMYRGLWKQAVQRLLRNNNFPEFTARVCPAPCEGSCTLGINEPQVTIKDNEYAIIEKAFSEGWIKPCPPQKRTGKKVAVIGSGPAGLACADMLNKAGHTVTVFERDDRIGGLLIYGIPSMKLDKEIVRRRIRLMEDEGVAFVANTEVGVNYPVKKLSEEYDATVLCCGATKPRELLVEGRELKGVYHAMDFLVASTKSQLNSNFEDNKLISAKDKNIIVIGGGDTAVDCVATSIRHGCKSIKQFIRKPQPPMNRSEQNPWPELPRTYKQDYGQKEAEAIFGKDPRQFQTRVKKMIGDENGNIKEVQTVRVEWDIDSNGRMISSDVVGSEEIHKVEMLLLALGFSGPEDTIIKEMGVECDKSTNVCAPYGSFMTNISGVFSAGDMRRGQSLVVWAINEGRGAARECDRYLMGETYLP